MSLIYTNETFFDDGILLVSYYEDATHILSLIIYDPSAIWES
jgi:hypothetical protein